MRKPVSAQRCCCRCCSHFRAPCSASITSSMQSNTCNTRFGLRFSGLVWGF
jgi:hypothetical protein